MARKGILDAIPDAKRVTLAHEEDGVWRVESRQDTSHIAKAASIIADQPPGKDFRHVGFIPDADLNRMLLDGSFHDPAAIRQFFDDHPCYRTGRW